MNLPRIMPNIPIFVRDAAYFLWKNILRYNNQDLQNIKLWKANFWRLLIP